MQPVRTSPGGKRAMLWTLGGIGAAVLAGALLVYSYTQNQRDPKSAQQMISGVAVDGADPENAPDDYQYVLRDKDGRLAVYAKDAQEPQMVLDVPVRVLPEYDQRQLEGGIYIRDYAELVERIEDFIS